ncbi:MAG: acetylglutamate kinase [Chromatiales bacterium]|nr:acetylglutamate kinase [Chromatiales bacterium]
MANKDFSNADRVRVLSEALSYIQKFYGKTIVVKYGGSAMTEASLRHGFARDVVLLKAVGMHPLIVHGGGPNISRNLAAAGIESIFVNGLRVTGSDSIEIIKKTLAEINLDISRLIEEHGGQTHNIVADQMITATKLYDGKEMSDTDLGLVGEVATVSPELDKLTHHPTRIPLIAPLGIGSDGQCYNINADWVASSIAAHLATEKLILMTNTAGVLDKQGELITQATESEISKLVAQKTIHSGMLPKVSCALKAIFGGTKAAHIIDGRTPHAVLLELLTDGGVGTLIKH